MKNIKIKVQKGFTLVELVVVCLIVVLLSVIAAPKIIEFRKSARAATLESIAGSLMSAHDLVLIKSKVQGSDQLLDGKTKLSQGDIDVHYGRPRSHWSTTWQKILDIDALESPSGDKYEKCVTDFTYCALYLAKHETPGYTDDWTIYIVPKGFAVNDNCYARYTLDILTAGKDHLVVTEAVTNGC